MALAQYGLHIRKLVNSNLPQVSFELGSLGPQASMLPIELPLQFIGIIVFIISSINEYRIKEPKDSMDWKWTYGIYALYILQGHPNSPNPLSVPQTIPFENDPSL